MYDLIVIGAGPGGYDAAAHAGHMGKKVALVEKQWVGGTCLNVGCIPAKAFLQSSRLYRECAEAKAFGVEVDAFRFDMPTVVERKNRIVGTLVKGVEGLLKRAGVEVLNGHGRLVARNRVQVGDEVLEAANILLATGSRIAVPPIPGIDAEGVLDSTSVFQLTEVPSRVAIVGGGYIGLEFASFFSEIGVEVNVFEMLPQIAAGCDGDVSDRLLQTLKRSGVSFNLSCRVVGIEGGTVSYEDSAGEKKSYVADRVLNATGRVPVVEDLGLAEVGVDFSRKGVRVNDQGKTNVPGVWACGDVNGQYMLAHVATREGIVAVNSMFGRPDRVRYDAVPAVIYTHPEVASAGRTEEQLKAAGIEYVKAMVPMGVAGRFLIENEKGSGFVKVLAGAKHGEILGVHAMGDPSSEWIVTAAAIIECSYQPPGRRGHLPAPDGVRSVTRSDPPGRSQDIMTKVLLDRAGPGIRQGGRPPHRTSPSTPTTRPSPKRRPGTPPEDFLDIWRDMCAIREFENILNEIKLKGTYRGITYNHAGPAHLSMGQEAAAVGMAFALGPEDHIFGSHRSHGEILAKAFSAIRALSDDELSVHNARLSRWGGAGARWRRVMTARSPALARAVLRVRRLQRDVRPGDGVQPGPGRVDACLLRPLRHLPQQRHRRRLGVDRPGRSPVQEGQPQARHRRGQHRRRLVRLRPGVGGHHLCQHGPVPQPVGPVAGRRPADHLQLHEQFLRHGWPARGRDDEHQPIARVGAGVNPEQMHTERVNGYNPLAVIDAFERKKQILSEGRGPVLLDTITYRLLRAFALGRLELPLGRGGPALAGGRLPC